MKTLNTLTLAAALLAPALLAVPAAAQAPAEGKPALTEAMPMTEGEIRKISKDIGKLTIKHGEIKNLDMPPMTMVFTAKDPALLDRVTTGNKVRFTAIEEDGKLFVTDIQPVK